MIFELAQDFYEVVEAMPREHPKHRMLELLEEAVRRDIHFIARHPTTLFQCIWNTCWWYDCPETGKHYEKPEGGWTAENAGWLRQKKWSVCQTLEHWRAMKEEASTGAAWLRSLRPPVIPLGGVQQAVFSGHKEKVNCLVYSADGALLATGSDDGSVRIWDTKSGAVHVYLPDTNCHSVCCLSFSPLGDRVVSGTIDFIHIWDTATGAHIRGQYGTKFGVRSVEFSSDGQRILSAGGDGEVRLWDANDGTLLHWFEPENLNSLSVRGFPVNCARFIADDKRFVMCRANGDVVVHDIQSDTIIAQRRLPEPATMLQIAGGYKPALLTYSPGDSKLHTLELDDLSLSNEVMLPGYSLHWHLRAKTDIEDYQRGFYHFANEVAFSTDGRLAARCSDRMVVQVWNTSDMNKVNAFGAHSDSVLCLAISPDAKQLATGAYDGAVRLWNIRAAVNVAKLNEPPGRLLCIAGTIAGDQVAVGYEIDGVRIYSTVNGIPHPHVPDRSLLTAEVVSFSPNGQIIAVGVSHHGVHLFDVASGKEVGYLLHHSAVSCLSFLSDGVRIVVGDEDGLIKVWNIADIAAPSFQDLTTLWDKHEDRSSGRIVALAFSRDERMLFSLNQFGEMCKWEVATDGWRGIGKNNSHGSTSLACSPDGNLVALGASDGRLLLSNIFSSQPYKEDKWWAHRGRCAVRQLAFSPDGSQLVSTGEDDMTCIWDVATGKCLAEIRGQGNAAQIAAGPKAFPYRALMKSSQTIIEDNATGDVVTWYGYPIDDIKACVGKPTWMGGCGNHLSMVTLMRRRTEL